MKFLYGDGDRPLEGYTIRKPLGHGGFGEVYHAISEGGKEVALKLVQRFLEVELRGVGHCLNLKHRHLLTLHDVRKNDKGDDWIVMEYVAGESLADLIDRNPEGLPVDEAVRWIREILAGVEHLHQAGIVHRDLKPSNIFDDSGCVKVGDYGLAKFITASRRSGHTQSVGTVFYMAPEVGSGRYGREVDIYAIGVIFYEMLTGNVPFPGETPAEVLMKHLTAAPDLSALPVALRGIVGRMLAKRPQDRYGSPEAVLADLKVRLSDAELGVVDDEDIIPDGFPSAPFAATGQYFGHAEEPPPSVYPAPAPLKPLWKKRLRRLTDFIGEHPVLCSVAVLATLAMMAMMAFPLAIFGGGAGRSIFLLQLLLSLTVSVVFCVWAFVWRAISRPPVRRRDRDAEGGPSGQQVPGDAAAIGKAEAGTNSDAEASEERSGAEKRMPWPVKAVRTGVYATVSRMGRLAMALLFAVGIGLLAGGMLTQLVREEVAVFLGVGIGCLIASGGIYWLFRRTPLRRGGRHLVTLLGGVGAGFWTSGIVLLLDRRADEAAAFFGMGAGFLTGGVLAYGLMCWSTTRRLPRVLAALFFGASVGLWTSGFGMALGARDDAAVLFGTGAAFVSCAVIAYLLCFGPSTGRYLAMPHAK